MPELRWRYGYPATLVGMAAVMLGLAWYFKRKDWW
jgi:magnesium transporter